MSAFIFIAITILAIHLWFGKKKYIDISIEQRKSIKALEAKIKELEVIDWESLRQEKASELQSLQEYIERQVELLDSLKADTLSVLNGRRKRIHECTEKLYPEKIVGEYDYSLVDEKYKSIKKRIRCYAEPSIANLLCIEYPKDKGSEFEFKVAPHFAVLLFDHLDMIIDKNIGNPYKKGIERCREIVENAFSEIDEYIPTFFPYRIKDSYIEDKMEIIRLKYELEEYKERKAEERKAILQAEREERAAQREIEREIKRAEKDELEAQAKLQKRQLELTQAKSEAEITRLREHIYKLEQAVIDAQQRHERALSMAQQTRSGYVYVISNIGSFGEGVYKIGMTRRIEPMERVIELSGASVPFPFDVHAMIWSEDAPTMEATLHRIFDNRKVNAINGRKEFFRVTLDEIRTELERMNVEVNIVEYPIAAQYRDTQLVRESILTATIPLADDVDE